MGRLQAVRAIVPLRGALAAVLVALAACGGNGQPAATGTATVAYVVTSCRQTGADTTLQQDVRVLRGQAEPVTVLSVGPLGPFPGFLCGAMGSFRTPSQLFYGPVQRFNITPDGSGLVYELTDEFVLEGRGMLPAEQRGIYYMRTDGSGLRRLGPASRSPSWWSSPDGSPCCVQRSFAFDPAGQSFLYVDRGPDEAGHEAAQVFVRGLMPGAATQVTRLPALDLPGQWPDVLNPLFLDGRAISFARPTQTSLAYLYWIVDVDGTDLRDVPLVALPGEVFVPVYQIVGGHWSVADIYLPGAPVNPSGDSLSSITEVIVFDGPHVLQLTNFGRADTAPLGGFYSARDDRVYFTASADPFGTNPSENCQIFSVDPLGRDLRQLTFFREGAAQATNGCFGGQRPYGCRIDFSNVPFKSSQDPYTGTIFFKSSCDPLGRNPNGWQLFTMQPDGSGLRQLTNARGRVRGADGSIDVETVANFWSAPYE